MCRGLDEVGNGFGARGDAALAHEIGGDAHGRRSRFAFRVRALKDPEPVRPAIGELHVLNVRGSGAPGRCLDARSSCASSSFGHRRRSRLRDRRRACAMPATTSSPCAFDRGTRHRSSFSPVAGLRVNSDPRTRARTECCRTPSRLHVDCRALEADGMPSALSRYFERAITVVPRRRTRRATARSQLLARILRERADRSAFGTIAL